MKMKTFFAALGIACGVAFLAAEGARTDCNWTVIGYHCQSQPHRAAAFAVMPDCGFEGCGAASRVAEIITVEAGRT